MSDVLPLLEEPAVRGLCQSAAMQISRMRRFAGGEARPNFTFMNCSVVVSGVTSAVGARERGGLAHRACHARVARGQCCNILDSMAIYVASIILFTGIIMIMIIIATIVVIMIIIMSIHVKRYDIIALCELWHWGRGRWLQLLLRAKGQAWLPAAGTLLSPLNKYMVVWFICPLD